MLLKALPSIDYLLRDDKCQPLLNQFGKRFVLKELQSQLSRLRHEIQTGNLECHSAYSETRESLTGKLITSTSGALNELFAPSLRPIINLSGVILHTNLGRAPYPQTAIDAMVNISRGATNLEFNLHNGKRGHRDDHVEQWICRLTGAEAATVVNNNAAAVLLVLNTLAAKKEVIVSRGELIEIGGSFRMPAIMKKATCKLREVGTTNRTHLADYRDAMTKKTAALMKVHTSNYEINGFTKGVSAIQLSSLAKESNVALIDDLGSGCLTDLTPFGLPTERTASQAIADGTDIITFSGDKLLGGPQCGIIAGKSSLIEKIQKNPMKRAMRLDKITLAALEAVLKLYAKPDELADHLPALRILSRTSMQIQQTAVELKTIFTHLLPDSAVVTIEACQSQIGSGALPTKTLNSHSVVVQTGAAFSAEHLAAALRKLPQPVIGRIKKDALYFDCRALETTNDIGTSLKSLPELL